MPATVDYCFADEACRLEWTATLYTLILTNVYVMQLELQVQVSSAAANYHVHTSNAAMQACGRIWSYIMGMVQFCRLFPSEEDCTDLDVTYVYCHTGATGFFTWPCACITQAAALRKMISISFVT